VASLCLRCGHYGFSDLVSPWVVGIFRSNIHSGQQNHNTMTAIVSEKQKGGSGQQQEEEENKDEQQEQEQDKE